MQNYKSIRNVLMGQLIREFPYCLATSWRSYSNDSISNSRAAAMNVKNR